MFGDSDENRPLAGRLGLPDVAGRKVTGRCSVFVSLFCSVIPNPTDVDQLASNRYLPASLRGYGRPS